MVRVERPQDQGELLGAGRLVAEHLRRPFDPAAAGEARLGDARDHMVLFQPIGDEVADGADLEAVIAREAHQVVEPGHGPVLAHDLADHARRIEPGEPRDIDRRFGMAGADQHAAGARDQREDVAGRDQGLRAVVRIDRHRDGAGAVGGADSGRNALARLDRDGEGGLVAAAVGAGHRLEPERVDAFLAKREADQAAAVARHEVDRVGRRHLRRDDEIALILAVVVVDQDEHAAVARLVDDRFGADQHAGGVAADQLFQPRPACRRSDSSRARPVCASELGWRPAARARPERLTSPVAMTALSRSIRVVLMARRYHIAM